MTGQRPKYMCTFDKGDEKQVNTQKCGQQSLGKASEKPISGCAMLLEWFQYWWFGGRGADGHVTENNKSLATFTGNSNTYLGEQQEYYFLEIF